MWEKFRGPNDIGVRDTECECWVLASGEDHICEKHQPQDGTVESFQAFNKRRADLMQAAKDAHNAEARQWLNREARKPPKGEPEPGFGE